MARMRTGWAVLVCFAELCAACSGGAGSSGPGDGGSSEDAGDATTPAEAGGDSSSMDVAVDSSLLDSSLLDSSLVDSSPADSSLVDAAPEAGSADAGEAGSTTDAAADTGSVTDAAPDAPPPIVHYEPGVVVSTLAGNGAYGDVDGPDASFANPTGIALYGSGVIVVENDTGAIRTVSAAGATTTIATSPVEVAQTSPFTIVSAPAGYYYSTDFDQSGTHVDGGGAIWSFVVDDAGSGTSSLLRGGLYVPRTLVPLPGGETFVFDTATSAWAPITEEVAELLGSGGTTLSLIAGDQGQTGFANGDGGAALFGNPTVGGVLLPDGTGVVVADCGNSQLRLVALDGSVSTFAGSTTAGWVDGPIASARFSCPHALAIDAAGNIYVSDWNNNAIRRISAGGNVTTLAGNGTQGYADGAGNVAEFYGAEGLIVSADGTTLFIADGTAGNGAIPYNRIRSLTLPAPDAG